MLCCTFCGITILEQWLYCIFQWTRMFWPSQVLQDFVQAVSPLCKPCPFRRLPVPLFGMHGRLLKVHQQWELLLTSTQLATTMQHPAWQNALLRFKPWGEFFFGHGCQTQTLQILKISEDTFQLLADFSENMRKSTELNPLTKRMVRYALISRKLATFCFGNDACSVLHSLVSEPYLHRPI